MSPPDPNPPPAARGSELPEVQAPAGTVPTIAEPAVEHVARPEPGRDARVRRLVALGVALVADILQWVAFPLFMSGAASPFDDALDVAVAIAMASLVGWHWAFLPAFVVELVPLVDLVPSWTLAWWIATRGRGGGPGTQPVPR